MLFAAEITPNPEEQQLIDALSDGFEPLHDPRMPYHHFEHSHDDVLPEVLRLDELSTGSPAPSRRRRQGIGFSIGHDTQNHLPLYAGEGFDTKEERSSQIASERLPDYGYDRYDIRVIREMIEKTAPGSICATDQEREGRRADISNVAGKRLSFLTNTVNIFYEEKLLDEWANTKPLDWRTFIIMQEGVLLQLLSQDLSLSSEHKRSGVGPFNRAAMKNVSWLSKNRVRNPYRFASTYGHLLAPLVPLLSKDDFVDQAAA